jgi:magnesium transporter
MVLAKNARGRDMSINYFQETGGAFVFGFASMLIGKPVIDSGHRVGRVRDLVARRGGMYPQVEGAVVRKNGKDLFLPIESFLKDLFDPRGGLKANARDLRELIIDDQHFLVRNVLMDKQIVDVQGAKVERVNDVHLLTVENHTYLVHVDVGFTGLLRRLGFEDGIKGLAKLFGRVMRDEMISWRYVQTLTEGEGPGPVRLAIDQATIKELHPGELADILEDLSKDERVALLHTVDTETAANALEEVEPELGASIVKGLDPTVAADIIEEMEPSAAADIFEELPEAHQAVIMRAMEPDERDEIQMLQTFEERTSGALMTTDFLTLPPDKTVSDALQLIRESAEMVELIQYIYLTDQKDRLLGAVSIKRLILSNPVDTLESLATPRVVSVKPDDSRETVAEMFYKYNFSAIPVVDESEKLIGIISYKHSFDELVPYYYRQVS